MGNRSRNRRKNQIPLMAFAASATLLIFLYGFAVARWRLFPHSILDSGIALIKAGYAELKLQSLRWEDVDEADRQSLPWWYNEPRKPYETHFLLAGQPYPGLCPSPIFTRRGGG